jgi:hypothetical protein
MSAPPTPLEQIDLLLAAWDERLRRMDENLVALESEAIYQILAGKAGKRPALEGVTRQRVHPALDAVTELFENRERLAAVVNKARGIRASISALTFWDTDEKIAEIDKLLRGPSIELGPRVIALSQRNLLDRSHHDVILEPERLLGDMVHAFEAARTVLLDVSRAWESLDPAMTGIERDMTALRALAAELHPPGKEGEPAKAGDELAVAEAELAALRARVQKDPLGVDEGVARGIVPRLTALRTRLDAELAARTRVLAALDVARATRRRIDEVHERALARDAELAREIEGRPDLPRPLDQALLEGLDQWLHKIEGTIEGRRWSPAEVGLGRWQATAEHYRAVDEEAAGRAEAVLGLRGELSGRLSARRAQAAALAGRGHALEPAAEARAREADELLRRRPTPIAEAARAVEQYEAAVVARSGRR